MGEFNLEVWQAGEMVASVHGADFDRVHADAMHYALMYGTSGPVEIRGIPMDRLNDLKQRLTGP